MPELESAAESLPSFDPATGEHLGTAPLAREAEVAASVARAREAFEPWRALGYAGRRRHLLAWRQALVEQADELARALTRENGKPLTEALQEVYSACEFLAYYAHHAERLLADEPIRIFNPLLRNRETLLTYEPRGVIAVISPWNYPVLLTMAELSGALATGNTVVLKPSEHTPLVTLALARTAASAGLPPGVLEVVTGDGRTGAALSAAEVDRVCFTGSVATGKVVARAAIDRLVPATLELGGKDPALVLEDADLDFTARGLVWGAFCNAGQACASVERVYVPRAIAAPLTAKILAHTARLVVGNGLDAATEVGPIISVAQLERIDAQVRDAVAHGARVLAGGQRLERPGQFYAPTVLADVTPAMAVMREETFGPVLPIQVVDSEAEMLRLANDSPFGLSATVWTRDLSRGKALARALRAGSVWINTGLASYGNPLTPRGGMKASGIGKIGGRLGLLEMVDAKLIDVADQGAAKAWWYPFWPNAYAFFRAGLTLLHDRRPRKRLAAAWQYLRSRR